MSTESKEGHAAAAHGGHHNRLGHVAPKRVLIGIWIALLFFTVLTVSVTHWDFGANVNLLLAMAIAVVKATLVALFFMHLRYDKLFHTVVFFSAVLLALLFVSFTLMDSSQYQTDIQWKSDTLSPHPY